MAHGLGGSRLWSVDSVSWHPRACLLHQGGLKLLTPWSERGKKNKKEGKHPSREHLLMTWRLPSTLFRLSGVPLPSHSIKAGYQAINTWVLRGQSTQHKPRREFRENSANICVRFYKKNQREVARKNGGITHPQATVIKDKSGNKAVSVKWWWSKLGFRKERGKEEGLTVLENGTKLGSQIKQALFSNAGPASLHLRGRCCFSWLLHLWRGHAALL